MKRTTNQFQASLRKTKTRICLRSERHLMKNCHNICQIPTFNPWHSHEIHNGNTRQVAHTHKQVPLITLFQCVNTQSTVHNLCTALPKYNLKRTTRYQQSIYQHIITIAGYGTKRPRHCIQSTVYQHLHNSAFYHSRLKTATLHK